MEQALETAFYFYMAGAGTGVIFGTMYIIFYATLYSLRN
jgi:hypothetical protein